MKKTVFLMLCASLCISFMATSCDKKEEKPATTEPEPCVDDAMVYYSVYKTKADYSDYVYMSADGSLRSKDKENINTSWDDEVWSELVKWYSVKKLKNGYCFVPFVHRNDIVYTDVTLEEYDRLKKEYSSEEQSNSFGLIDTLKKRIIDNDPVIECYKFRFGDPLLTFRDSIWQAASDIAGSPYPNIDKINEMIESGEFFTYEGVERIK